MPENLPHRAPAATPMQATEWEGDFPARIRQTFPALALSFKSYLGQNYIEAPAAAIADLLLYFRQHEAFDVLTDLTAVDYPTRPERFEIIYILYSLERNERIRVKVHAALDHDVPTATAVYPAANWLEREVFDMFGIRFSGHPDLKRILLPEDWQGHPLRKELSITAMDNEWVQRNLGIESGQS
ncbi:MAG TPA: NADH-quinone oxidoreductase subunit C [Bryobacteraceae bacterium]|nr:NADH-quinone oxidoreductase subunit C [Bryobacteraceae bacterium]